MKRLILGVEVSIAHEYSWTHSTVYGPKTKIQMNLKQRKMVDRSRSGKIDYSKKKKKIPDPEMWLINWLTNDQW